MLDSKNFEDVFIRNIIVGLCQFFYATLEIPEVKDGEKRMKKIPFFYSMSGGNSEQYIQDMYANTDKFCDVLSPVEGNTIRIPSAVISLGSNDISQQDMGSGYVRLEYLKDWITELTEEERQMTARGDIIPIIFDFEIKMKASSEIERFKMWEAVIKKFYKVKKFWIRYGGFPKLPVTVAFPEVMNQEKNFQFRFAETDKRPQLTYKIEVLGHLPVIDESTERFAGNVIDDINMSLETGDVIDDSYVDPNETDDPNNQYDINNPQEDC